MLPTGVTTSTAHSGRHGNRDIATSALTSIGCLFQTNSDLFHFLYFFLSVLPHLSPAPSIASFFFSHFLSFFVFVSLSFVYVTYDEQQGTGGLRFFPGGFVIMSC